MGNIRTACNSTLLWHLIYLRYTYNLTLITGTFYWRSARGSCRKFREIARNRLLLGRVKICWKKQSKHLFAILVYAIISLGATIHGRRSCLSTYDYIRASLQFGGVAHEESIEKGSWVLLEIVGVTATVVGAIVTLLHYLHDIRKDRKQKSNRPSQGKGC